MARPVPGPVGTTSIPTSLRSCHRRHCHRPCHSALSTAQSRRHDGARCLLRDLGTPARSGRHGVPTSSGRRHQGSVPTAAGTGCGYRRRCPPSVTRTGAGWRRWPSLGSLPCPIGQASRRGRDPDVLGARVPPISPRHRETHYHRALVHPSASLELRPRSHRRIAVPQVGRTPSRVEIPNGPARVQMVVWVTWSATAGTGCRRRSGQAARGTWLIN